MATHLALSDYLITLPRLQGLLKLGFKIKLIKKVYTFPQSFYLKTYMDKMSAYRAQQTTPEGKNLIKIMLNSVYGATIKDPARYAKTHKIITCPTKLVREVTKPTFDDLTPITPSRVVTTSRKSSVLMNSPNFIGFCTLDFSKKNHV